MPLLEPTFYILYLKNFKSATATNELEMLLRNPNKNPKKLVCQFFHNAQNTLTLALFGGKQNHKHFSNFPFVPILGVTDAESTTKIDIKGKDVFLSDQEISGKELEKLDDLVNVKDHEYIGFSPVLQSASQANRFAVVYEIGSWKKDDFEKAGLLLLPPKPIGVAMNPSPPRDGF